MRNLALNIDQLKLVSVDRQALEPLSPVKPRKVLIVLLGLGLGVLMGVFAAIMRYLVVSHRISTQGLEVLQSTSPVGIPKSM